ncbi:hypothetical protein Pse7367_3583 [Thalassoporum mexicanum PCC 7367]|nr:hypothetical protein Pse7367_3583 [Pseudanabaena sp. PCC 7367]
MIVSSSAIDISDCCLAGAIAKIVLVNAIAVRGRVTIAKMSIGLKTLMGIKIRAIANIFGRPARGAYKPQECAEE